MIQHITRQEQETSVWSGGTTTQLFIYPTESSYAERNFLLRISSATVDVEESDFTLLPGYQRLLMLLNGRLHITHKNQGNEELLPFQVHAFSGDWQTHARGKVTDFNVIYHPKLKPTLSHQSLSKYQTNSIALAQFNLVYVVSGEITFDSKTIYAQDAIFIAHQSSLFVQAQEDSILIIVSLPELP